MAASPPNVVRTRCSCGQGLRIRNAQAGQAVVCPRCGQSVHVTTSEVDGQVSELRGPTASPSARASSDSYAAPRPALPLDASQLRLASHGARTGLTGKLAHTHDEALLMTAFTGRPLDEPVGAAARSGGGATAAMPSRRAVFIDDLLATFYLVGLRSNFLHVFGAAAIFMFFIGIAGLFTLFPRFVALVALVLVGLAAIHLARYCWQILLLTATGDDELPLVDQNWDPWEDALLPTLRMIVLSVACAAPAWLAWRYRGLLPATLDEAVIVALALAGTVIWPVLMMSVAVSDTILTARPDLVFRTMRAIGPVYLLAWLVVTGTFATLASVYITPMTLPTGARLTPLWAVFPATPLTFYGAYVIFRTLGLLYRHSRTRLPWDA